MNTAHHQPTSTALKLAVAGLVGNAAGIWMQAFSGDPDYPAIPPGPIVLIVVALGVAFTHRRWWWTPIIGTLLSLLITVGAFMTPGTARRLNDPAAVGPFIGTLIQLVSLAVGIVAGLVATTQNYRRRVPERAASARSR
jgi:hypothetical protein